MTGIFVCRTKVLRGLSLCFFESFCGTGYRAMKSIPQEILQFKLDFDRYAVSFCEILVHVSCVKLGLNLASKPALSLEID